MLILMSTVILPFYLPLADAITSIIQSAANQVPTVTSIPKPNSVFNASIEKYGPMNMKTKITAIVSTTAML